MLSQKPHIGPNFLDRPKTARERAASRWGLKEKSSLSLRIASDKTLPGQYFDEETNLHYNWKRYYDPQLGRYITSDPIGIFEEYANYNQKLNHLYLYANANPLTFMDQYGLFGFPDTFCDDIDCSEGARKKRKFECRIECELVAWSVCTLTAIPAGLINPTAGIVVALVCRFGFMSPSCGQHCTALDKFYCAY